MVDKANEQMMLNQSTEPQVKLFDDATIVNTIQYTEDEINRLLAENKIFRQYYILKVNRRLILNHDDTVFFSFTTLTLCFFCSFDILDLFRLTISSDERRSWAVTPRPSRC